MFRAGKARLKLFGLLENGQPFTGQICHPREQLRKMDKILILQE